MALGVPLFGWNVPVPPLTTDQEPSPTVGVLPPRPSVVPEAQMVCGPPTVAEVGAWLTVTAQESASVTCAHGARVAFTVKVADDDKAADVRTRFDPVPTAELPDVPAPLYN